MNDTQAAAWLESLQDGRLNPPRDVHDAAGWNAYWAAHLGAGLMEQAFADMMSSDPPLPGRLAARGVRNILCAGNGLSGEALALALFGFNVTALDISTVPGGAMGDALRQPNHPVNGIPEFSIGDDNGVRVNDPQ